MGHSLTALGSASLDTMGGLITLADPRDVPEGASPRCWDVDYIVGSVFTRDGLRSVYSYTTTLLITGYSNTVGIATFYYTGPEPIATEGFLLSGFVGAQAYLNGQTVYVISVTPTTFTASVSGSGSFHVSNLSGSAVSTSGLFVGPKLGTVAIGSAWNTPSNLFSSVAYASNTTGIILQSGPTTTMTVTQDYLVGYIPWAGGVYVPYPDPLKHGTPYASVTGSAAYNAYPLFLTQSISSPLVVPSNATVAGVAVVFNSTSDKSSNVSVQLTVGGIPVGSAVDSNPTTAWLTYTLGDSGYLWGTTFTPANITSLGANIYVSTPAGGTVKINNFQVIVYYATGPSALLGEDFPFVISLSSGVTGFGVSFNGRSIPTVAGAYTSVSLQLLNNGVPVGTPKVVQLASLASVYTLGGSVDMWGTALTTANVNSPTFGVQVMGTGSGTTLINNLKVTVYITPALESFNWIGSYEQNNGALTTLALDAGGNLWKEDVINNPNNLSLALSGLLPGSFANGATIDNSEFIMFSDLSVGTDRPRQLDVDGNFYPVSQVGPGAPPSFVASQGTLSGKLTLVSYSWTSTGVGLGTALFTYTAASVAPVVGTIYVVNGTGTTLDGQAVIVTGSPTPSVTQFASVVTGTYGTGTVAVVGTLTPQFHFDIASITQYPAYSGTQEPMPLELSAGATTLDAGNVVTFYYQDCNTGGPDNNLLNAYNDPLTGAYVLISGTPSAISCDGIYQVIAMGQNRPPAASDQHWFFSIQIAQSGAQNSHSYPGVTYRQTLAKLTFPAPGVIGIAPGSPITITGATPSGWDHTWTISEAINTGQYVITSTSSTAGVATYTYQYAGLLTVDPIAGYLITITGCLQAPGYNGTFIIDSVNVGTSSFTVNGLNLPDTVGGPVDETDTGQAAMSGTEFYFDPGETYLGTNVNVIYGDDTATGHVTIIGTSIIPLGAGTRQATVFFITESGNWTPVSNPCIPFTTPAAANLLNVSNLPIGPPNVIARGVAITEAGANGVPGANYYVITNPVTVTVNGVTTTYSSTIVNDNTTQSTSFTFTDAILLNSTEIDIPGRDLFNTIELGSCAWCVPYSSRMFYGLQLNKVDNFINLSFDGGYQVANQPAGWSLALTIPNGVNELQLVNSPVTLTAALITNPSSTTQSVLGMMYQTAYLDTFNVPIIEINTLYSVRVSCSNPTGISGNGSLVIDLTSYNAGSFGKTYGTFSVPLSSMGSLPTVFSGALLPLMFTTQIPVGLQLRVWAKNLYSGSDILIDRIEVYPTEFPYLKTEVYGSYINQPEEIDATGDGGIIDTSTENPQACMGGFVMRDSLYLLKTNSMYVTKDNPNSEPSGWSLNEVSDRVGTVGINAYDTGDEWAITACRAGLYGFDGKIPLRLNQEIFQIWEAINWDAGNTIVVRNDIYNRRVLCAVPLPTGTSPSGVPTVSVQWLPYAPYVPKPTSPNVILMVNYQAFGTFDEFINNPEIHVTMMGKTAVQDMKRKWAIWNIATPYMGAVLRGNYVDSPLYVCNGVDSSKIYVLDADQLSDDGAAINGLYTTYSFVSADKAVTMPIFGMHTKRYTILQQNLQGSGNCTVRMLPNDLNSRYPISIPGGINLVYPAQDDFVRSINVKGQRVFLEYSTNQVGSWFQLCKILLTGKADPWSSLNPTGGGNAGIV